MSPANFGPNLFHQWTHSLRQIDAVLEQQVLDVSQREWGN
jgi:hypothetical protein